MHSIIIRTAALNEILGGEGVQTIEFRCPSDGGYVRLGNGAQVCETLATRGAALSATPNTLEAVVRRELRRRVRINARERV